MNEIKVGDQVTTTNGRITGTVKSITKAANPMITIATGGTFIAFNGKERPEVAKVRLSDIAR